MLAVMLSIPMNHQQGDIIELWYPTGKAFDNGVPVPMIIILDVAVL